MSAAAAARMGDEVAHGFGLLAMVGGALLGAAVGAAIIGATAVTGGAALAVVAGTVAAGGLSLGQLVKGVTKVFDLPEPSSGVLQSGSGNARINSRLAVRAEMDIAACSGFPINHFPLPAVPVAEGSASVRINGKPAARIGSKLMCGAHIKGGSKNVTIGGPTVRVLGVYDTEEWAEWGLTALGVFALGVGGRAIYLAGGKAALGKFAGAALAGLVGFEGLGQLGDAMGPGYRDVLQGVAGLVLLGAGYRAAQTSLRNSKGIDKARIYGGKGPVSGRTFDPEKAGGPIRKLRTDNVKITKRGIDVVKKHLSRFDEYDENKFMIKRLEKIASGEISAEKVDLNFYTHELREYVRYRKLGWETGVPKSGDDAYSLWNNTHTATLEEYGLNEKTIPHPLYHQDAP